MGVMAGARIIISGKVQGVFFRAETQKAASELGVTGWVRNRADGTVEVRAEGPEEGVKALIDWCHKGSPMSRVDRVDVEWEPYTGALKRFDVTY